MRFVITYTVLLDNVQRAQTYDYFKNNLSLAAGRSLSNMKLMMNKPCRDKMEFNAIT